MTISTKQPNDQRIVIHTDGSCIGNPGPGGWAAVLQSMDGTREVSRTELSGGEVKTTNNRMEMIAAIRAIQSLDNKDKPVTIISDSDYLIQGMNKWRHAWKTKGWKKSNNQLVENIDLWKSLDALDLEGSITWIWVKGHADNSLNERADELAREAAEKNNVISKSETTAPIGPTDVGVNNLESFYI
jgi:ribonuclease HI